MAWLAALDQISRELKRDGKPTRLRRGVAMDGPCQLCQTPDWLEPRAVKRIDLALMVAGHMLTTEMLLCQGCREMVDEAGPLVWLEDGYVFCKFADGVFAKRHDPERNATVLVNLPDETTYRPGRSSWPPQLGPHGSTLPQ